MQWETGFCTDIDSEKGILWMISGYNKLQYSHFFSTKLNLMFFCLP